MEGQDRHAGKAISILVVDPRAMYNSKIVSLQFQGPTRKAAFGLLQLLQPAERGVVSNNSEVCTVNIMPELLHSIYDRKALLLSHALVLLVLGQDARGISNRVVVSLVIQLGQDGSNRGSTGIGIEEELLIVVQVCQHRCDFEGFLEGLKGRLLL